MRIVVTGATGNVGTSVVDVLAADRQVDQIVGVARRRPRLERPRTTWVQADDEQITYAANVTGAQRVFEAVAAARVGALVHATPPLDPRAGGPLRLRELLSGVGGTSR